MTARHVAAELGGRQYMTTAVPLVAHDADDAEWLGIRRAGIGASEIASVCRVPGAFTSPFALWWAKRLGWETQRTLAMHIGTKLEPVIGELFAEEHPGVRLVRPAFRLYRHPTLTWMLASPDFLAVEDCGMCFGTGLDGGPSTGPNDPSDPVQVQAWAAKLPHSLACTNCEGEGGWVEPVECKSDEGRDWKGEPPPKHEMQLWQQELVFGARRGWLVRLNAKRLSAYQVDLDQGAADLIVTDGQLFADALKTGIQPDVDGHQETENALRRLYPPVADDDAAADVVLPPAFVAQFMAAWEAREDALAEFAVARNRIRYAMADARWAVGPGGEKLIEHRKYKKGGYEVQAHEVDEIRKAW